MTNSPRAIGKNQTMAAEITGEKIERPSTAGMTTKVIKGSLWTFAGQVAPLAVSLVATPFTIRLLGAEAYGVLILVGLIPTYLGFADFGMGMASTKFGSEAYAEGDEEKEARVVRTAALISLMTSVPVAAALMIFAPRVIGLFNVPEALQGEAATALRIAAVTLVVNFLCGIFNTPQLARLRMDLNTFINAGSRILGLIATPIILYLGFGIVGAVTVLLVASLINLAGHLIVSSEFVPKLLASNVKSILIRQLIGFGGGLAFASAAAMIVANAEKSVLPAYVDVKALAYYSVAFTLATMATLFSQAMIQSLTPAFSQLQRPEKRHELENLFFRVLRYNLLLVLPTFFILLLIAKPFFFLWAGPEFSENSVVPFFILLSGLLFNIPAYLPYALIIAQGRSDIFVKLYALESVPYLVLAVIFTQRWGINGAAAAWSLRIIIDALLLFRIAGSVNGWSFPLRKLCIRLLPGLILIIGLLAAFLFYNIWWVVLTVAVLSLTAYSVLAVALAFEKEEIAFVRQVIIDRFASQKRLV